MDIPQKAMHKTIPKNIIDTLYQLAKSAREKSYSPYSQYQVGAAVLMSDGKFFSGCNIENSSYGATTCAERVAIQKAISEGSTGILELLVLTDANPPWPPCGMCRQVISEFNSDSTGGQNVIIHLANLDGKIKSYPFKELFPQAFNPSFINNAQKKI